MMSTRAFLRRSLALAAFAATAGMSAQAGAVPFHMLFESDTDLPASSELSLASFASLADAVEGTLSDFGVSALNVNAGFSARGLAFDGSRYHLLIESDAGAGDGTVSIASFDSLNDLQGGVLSDFAVSALDVTAGFSVGGLVYDGSRFHMLFESDFDAGAGGEISIGSFDSIDAIVGGTLADFAVTDLDLASIFSVAGLAFDGERFHLLTETDIDTGPGSELHMLSFESLDDILSATLADFSTFLLDVNPAFNVGGFVAEASFDAEPPSADVPEPATSLMFASGLSMLCVMARRRFPRRSARRAS
jgi:hypothetical protein